MPPHPPPASPPSPYPTTQFNFAFKAEDDKSSLDVRFSRRTETMPQPPQVGRWWGAGGRP